MTFKIVLLATAGALIITGLTACSPEPTPTQNAGVAAASPAKPAEPDLPHYELTKDEVTSHPDWTSRNITVFGVKIGDVTRTVEKNLGPANSDATRNIGNDYLTIYQKNGLFVFTVKSTGKARKFEIYQTIADKVADPKLKKLLTTGDLKVMRDVLGQEERVEQTAEDPQAPATEYVYDSRGIRFIKYKVKGQTLNALMFGDVKRPS
jgi:hypothetical protein